MSARLLAGLDIGTTGCKLSVFDTAGNLRGRVYRDYPAMRSVSAQEIDAGTIWRSVRDVLREGAAEFPGIAGIGVTSFGETFVAVGADDEPLAPSMLYTDPRGEEQSARLAETLGAGRIAEITGASPSAMYSLPKLMWLKEYRPDLYGQIRHVMQMGEYVIYRLTGVAQVDHSLAARTMAFDIRALQWSDQMFQAAGIDPALFSRPVPTGTPAGRVRGECADLGLSPDTVIVSISHDQVAAAVGSGELDASATVDGAGTVECMTPVFSEWDTPRMAAGNYCVVPYVKPGTYVTYAFSYTGGALVQWYTEQLAGYAAARAKERGASVFDELEKGWDGEPTGILVLPHFAGAATPYMDTGSKGVIAGLTLAHTEAQLYAACMEGVCYEMRLNQERLADAGIAVAPLRATGGGAKSRKWLQMKADVLDLPVTALETSEAGGVGSAMLVGVALGEFADLREAARAMVRVRETFTPRPEYHAKYEANYQRYRQLYDAVRPLV